jgi:formate dehydrogenase subunit gamma
MSDYVVRFSLRQRCEHLAVMLLFLVLALTGFPQKFFDGQWARWTIATLGGIDHVRWLHRMAGVAFSVVAVVHVMSAVAGVLSGRSAFTMVPTRKDFTDAIVTLRYYLGLQDEHAHFDRYDYRQKFEYWGLILGGVVMVTTGFILYYPVIVAQVLPGDVIPAAKVAHSNEGLLAFLVVIIWHIYNAHLSPDVFPFDTSIFTGRVSRERMMHEHPLEYARLSEGTGSSREAGPDD